MPSSGLFPPDEAERLAALRALELLDTADEDRFDRITRIAARAFGVPIALVNLIDADRQWSKACIGLEGREMDRGQSFCARAIVGEVPQLVLEDTLEDPVFATSALVTGPPFLRFYAGHVLRAPSGHKVGTLCIAGPEPRAFGDEDRDLLADLGALAEQELASTELGAALRARSESEMRLRTVMDTVADGVVSFDDEGRIASVNPAAEEAFGLPAGYLVGENVSTLLQGVAWEDLQRMLRDGPDTVIGQPRQVLGRRGNGTTFPMELTVGRARLGRRALFVAVGRDVTERFEVDRMKDEFISVVGHELRTPLTSIRGSLGLLAGGVAGELPEQAQRMLGIALSNTDRLVRLINDILDLERMASGKVELEREPLTARALVADTVEVLGARADELDVPLHVSTDDGAVLGDHDRLVQALTNLAGNALKFSPPGEPVTLSARTAGDVVRFEVRDRGRGIPAGQLERIFERFEQVDASDAREKGGTGLGLPIARGIADQHGGRLWAESAEGEGATFVLELPRLHDGVDGRAGERRVLVAEDDLDLGRVLARALEERGAQVQLVQTGRQAVEALDVAPPDLLVLDVLLPEADGFQVVEHLRAHPRLAATPVVVYSAVDLGAEERERLRSGPTEVLVKARSGPDEVVAHVERLLEAA